MLMVIFGAGASYDSAPSRPPRLERDRDRPPLADELFLDTDAFSEVASRFPRCLPIIPRLRDRPAGVSVEQELEHLQQESEEYPDGHRQLAAIRFYLNVMLWNCVERWNQVTRRVTNYPPLLDQIKRRRNGDEQTCLVTFNYDTMLDAALGTVGNPIRTMDDYITGDVWKVIKIHGSVNWGRELDTPLEQGRVRPKDIAPKLIEMAPDLRISRRYQMVSQNLGSGVKAQEQPFSPRLGNPS